MTNDATTSLTAAQEILLGAGDLDASGMIEFSEWDLTVATWKRNQNRFGCRGYELKYPDHKRVTMVIMSKQNTNPIRSGWLERVHKNTYSITDLGRAEVEKLTHKTSSVGGTPKSPQKFYDALYPLYTNTWFRKHCKNKAEPRMWLGAASFLQLKSTKPQHLLDRIKATEKIITNAIEWIDENNTDVLHRGVSESGETISRENLYQLKDFYYTIIERFTGQIEAISKRQ